MKILEIIVLGPLVLALAAFVVFLPFAVYRDMGWLGVVLLPWCACFVVWLMLGQGDSLDP